MRQPVCMTVMKGTGHPNVTLLHNSTIELTANDYLTPRGDCIACIRANRVKIVNENCWRQLDKAGREESIVGRFVLIAIPFLKRTSYTIICGIHNRDYSLFDKSDRLVIRKSKWKSKDTLMIASLSSAKNIKMALANALSSSLTKCRAVYLAINIQL